jgi:hypothetical protein
MRIRLVVILFLFIGSFQLAFTQVVINEGCNRNYISATDEDGDKPDWIELYNAGNSLVDLTGYYLSDNLLQPLQWSLAGLSLAPNEFKLVYCSGKDRYESSPFSPAVNDLSYTPFVGWNTHNFTNTFNWDGQSNILLNICSYENNGYTENSIFKQTETPYASTMVAYNDGSDASCSALLGGTYNRRPNLKINGITLDVGTIQNSTTDYPAPYGNWYWSARHQILVHGAELIAAGLTAGPINSIGFEVVSTNAITYTYIDVSISSTILNELSDSFIPLNGYGNHSNFKLESNGESVFLSDPSLTTISSLYINSPQTDVSIGSSPDASTNNQWMEPSPGSSNNAAIVYTDSLKAPVLSVPTGILNNVIYLKITNPNADSIPTKVVYTLDGSEPTLNSTEYIGDSIFIFQASVVRAKAFPLSMNNYLASHDTYGTYLFNIDHSTPILLITTQNSNLYGGQGIFDNPNSDWLRAAHVTWLDKEGDHPALFQTRTAIRMDGGAGGSRGNPQRSFRLSFDHAALGEKTVNLPLIPAIPFRNKYSDVYLRNGSNQWLNFPQKDACQVSMMSKGTNNYYSSMEPVSVYINGQYFGLYDLREKFNTEYFDERENIKKDSIDILSMSYFYNLVLRAVEGKVEDFTNDYTLFNALDPTSPTYLTEADQYFDLAHYSDYIIGESWMGNVDWPGNNIKIYRSNKSNYRWRFALIDLELSMQPNGWTSCTDNGIRYMLDQSTDNPYINIWLQSIQNLTYRNSFINRYADLMNTSYLTDTLLATEQSFFNKMVLEMPKEYQRWGDPNNIAGQMDNYINNHLIFRQQLACRNEIVMENLRNEFQLTKEVKVELAIFPDSAGTIKLNSIQPKNYPWQGLYFDGVPIQLTAIAEPGYSFVKWLPNSFISDTLNPTFESNVNIDSTLFTAVFKLIPPPPDGPTISFVLYPSPSSNSITIEHTNSTLAKNVHFQIYDLNGRVLSQGNLDQSSKKTAINISTLNAAMYLIRITNDSDIVETLRFIKQ